VLQAWPAVMQHRFWNVALVSYVPKVISVVAHVSPVPVQHAVVEPGVHGSLFTSVQTGADVHAPFWHDSVPHPWPQLPQLSGSFAKFTHVFVVAQ